MILKSVKIAVVIFFFLSSVTWAQSLDLTSNTVPKSFKGDDIIAATRAPETGKMYVFKISNTKVFSSAAGVWVEKLTKNSWFTQKSVEEAYDLKKVHERMNAERSRKGLQPYPYHANLLPVLKDYPEDHYLVLDKGVKTRSFVGQNVFGATRRVESDTDTKYFVTPINGTEKIGKLKVTAPDSSVGVLFIGKPALHPQAKGTPPEKYVVYASQGGYNATFDSPYAKHYSYKGLRMELQEVWVYDLGSGQVLLKQKIQK